MQPTHAQQKVYAGILRYFSQIACCKGVIANIHYEEVFLSQLCIAQHGTGDLKEQVRQSANYSELANETERDPASASEKSWSMVASMSQVYRKKCNFHHQGIRHNQAPSPPKQWLRPRIAYVSAWNYTWATLISDASPR